MDELADVNRQLEPGTHRLHQRGQVIQRELGEVPEHHAALEGLPLHWLTAVLHKVHGLRGVGSGCICRYIAGVKD